MKIISLVRQPHQTDRSTKTKHHSGTNVLWTILGMTLSLVDLKAFLFVDNGLGLFCEANKRLRMGAFEKQKTKNVIIPIKSLLCEQKYTLKNRKKMVLFFAIILRQPILQHNVRKKAICRVIFPVWRGKITFRKHKNSLRIHISPFRKLANPMEISFHPFPHR